MYQLEHVLSQQQGTLRKERELPRQLWIPHWFLNKLRLLMWTIPSPMLLSLPISDILLTTVVLVDFLIILHLGQAWASQLASLDILSTKPTILRISQQAFNLQIQASRLRQMEIEARVIRHLCIFLIHTRLQTEADSDKQIFPLILHNPSLANNPNDAAENWLMQSI